MEETEGASENGSVVDLYGGPRRFLGRGYINADSQIVVRLLTREAELINADFFHRRIAAAIACRQRLAIRSTGIRVVHAEADALPGLVIDRYEDIVVVQISRRGWTAFGGSWCR